ncbi:MAG: TFIIB-type zinc ribbon-containing protein [Synergistaceae bacterium]|nr:TFIIB-type zinc ribbon-containing protein [Synergistaceae bacterium]MBQ4400968.1 TFIIB-type zinc ribbon-containing protein [Synergistaceae bacterium]
MTMSDNSALASVYGNPDDYEDYNANDRRLLSQGLFGVHKGDNPDVRQLFNNKFNQIVHYHYSLWRDRPAAERGFVYYAERYSRFFEDLFRLCEKFPDLPLDREYACFLERYDFYERSIIDFNNRKEARYKARADARAKEIRREREALLEAHPHLRENAKCPRCHSYNYVFDFDSGWYCTRCGY